MSGAADSVSPELHQQALSWLVTMWSGEASSEEQQALIRWRQASNAHEEAWQAVQQMQQRLRGVPATTAGPVLRAASRRNGRRAVLRTLALLCGGSAAFQAVRETESWQAITAQYSSATGERRNIVLADGSRIAMNTATALDVHFDAGQRRIDLHRGEIMITTGKDHGAPYRPFVVHTAHGTARALGTRFLLYQHGEQTQVQVYEGAVEVRPRLQPAAPQRVAAGSQLRLSAQQAGAPFPLPAAEPAWLAGELQAEQMRLQDFLAELARYRHGVIACEPAVANQLVSGVYPLDDTDKVLAALVQALPVQVRYRTRYWVSVQAVEKNMQNR